jgi:hypothetical protein
MIYEELAKNYLARSKEYAEQTTKILGQVADYQENGQTAAQTILAASLHVNMLSHDLLALQFLHSLTDDKWTNRLAARMLSTVIFEGADDLQHIFGRPFREACNEHGILEEIESDLGRIKRDLALLQTTHQAFLKAIRTAAGAHRDHDIVTFLDSFIDESKTTAVLNASIEFLACLWEWRSFCNKVTKRVQTALKN